MEAGLVTPDSSGFRGSMTKIANLQNLWVYADASTKFAPFSVQAEMRSNRLRKMEFSNPEAMKATFAKMNAAIHKSGACKER